VTFAGPNATAFITVNSAGVVSLIAPPNFEVQRSYVFNATVTDQGGLNATSVVTLTILNVNEAPVLPSSFTRYVVPGAVCCALPPPTATPVPCTRAVLPPLLVRAGSYTRTAQRAPPCLPRLPTLSCTWCLRASGRSHARPPACTTHARLLVHVR
jgi:hypothetical protein